MGAAQARSGGRERGAGMSRTSLALSNLRAFVILIVLGFHSVLAYLDSLPAEPRAFEVPPYAWQASPIVDSKRWFGFDLFCAWHDVYLMSLMFFLSGLFVWPSLARKGSWPFLRDRLLRLGLPLVLAVALLMPVALYPVYRVSAVDPSMAEYWRQWMALPFWPCGPQWFLWQLFALNIVAAALYRIAPVGRGPTPPTVRAGRRRGSFSPWWRTRRSRICRSRSGIRPGHGLNTAPLPSNRVVRFTMASIFSPASRSEPAASTAACWRPMACSRGTGRSGSRLRQ